MIEEYRIIKDYPDYAVSNLGNVKSLGNDKARKEKMLSPRINKCGYLRVSLCKNGEAKTYLIHRLVAEAFIPNPLGLPQVNHINEIKTDNRAENLEWCDCQYNIDYSRAKQVGQYDLSGNLVKIWKSVSEIQRQLGFDKSNISNCCTGYRNCRTMYGYIWRYI